MCLVHANNYRLFFTFALLASASAGAQMISAQGKTIDVFQVDEPPVIDGRLDDDA